jgi:tRNA nucleotidyltransferase (CCA-adding enzyme)
MQIYLVGGAVRDALLGLAVQDRDWVVVGATPQELLQQGFVSVGKDFPVFLHPRTHDEYALARTERKTAPGYHGFAIHAAPDVTLEEDLSRRDLTLNAMAVRADCTHTGGVIGAMIASKPETWQAQGMLVDPFHGERDIASKVLRHVSPAFAEDPVRILRVARLAARFADFTVALETLQLMRAMVQSGEVDHLVAERVWQELAKGLMEATPSRMLEVLHDCGALARLLPGIELESDPNLILRVLDHCARLEAPLPVRAACLLQKELESDPNYLRLPADCRELAQVLTRERSAIELSGELGAAQLVRLLERCDALRKPQRFGQILLACQCLARAESPYPPGQRLLAALAAAQSVATHAIATSAIRVGSSGEKIGELIHLARIKAVKAVL